MKYYPRKKKKRLQKINKKLIQRYPFLLPRNAWTGEPVEDYDFTWNELDCSIPAGWWKRFGVLLCEDLRESLVNANCLYDFRILQAKEKYGELRLYDNGCPEDWFHKLEAWTYISTHTCVKCGKFPVQVRNDGWISPWCDDCYEKKMRRNFRVFNKDMLVTDEDVAKEINKTSEGEFKLLEYLVISRFGKNGNTKEYIDMKPYYEKIGYKYNLADLVSKEEIDKIIAEKEKENKKNKASVNSF